MKIFQNAQREEFIVMRRRNSFVMGVPGRIYGNMNILSAHSAPVSTSSAGRIGIFAMIAMQKYTRKE